MKKALHVSLVSLGILLTAVAAIVTVLAYRVAKLEAALALSDEEMYLDFSRLRPPHRDASSTVQMVKLLSECSDPSAHIHYDSPVLAEKVGNARVLAISNLVQWLEESSGKQYGTNVRAWQQWLEAVP